MCADDLLFTYPALSEWQEEKRLMKMYILGLIYPNNCVVVRGVDPEYEQSIAHGLDSGNVGGKSRSGWD